jgi:hypothetical protein
MENYLKNQLNLLKSDVIKAGYRSYESDILNYFDEKNLRQYKEPLRKLFIILPDNSLVSIYKKIKKNSNKPSFAEHIVTDYFIKYDIPYFLKTKSETRKKENKENIKKRVKKYRANTKKVNFQVMISLELKNKIKKYCFDNGCTYEQMLLEKLYL